jgi:MFS family permease
VNTARWMDLVVLGWLALQLTGSPFMVGLAVFVRSAPMMAFGPFAGVVADRIHRGRVLLFNSLMAFLNIAPVAFTLARLGPRRETAAA